MRYGAILFALAIWAPTAYGDDNWPQFRGPNAAGIAKDDQSLPTVWSKTENVRWVRDLPGAGHSGPIVWDDKVFVTTVVSEQENTKPKKGLYLGRGVRTPAKGIHQWMLYCFDRSSGKTLWKREVHQGEPKVPRHPKSTYASETPVTDGERVYALFGDLGLYCLDLEGNLLWSHRIEPKKTFFDYGAAASPIAHDGQVIFVYDNQDQSYITALDGKTGKQRWQTLRDEDSTWATPYVWQNKLRTEIIVPGKKKNRSYDLAGNLLWEFAGRMSNLVIPSPFAAHGMVYITSGYIGDRHRPVFAVKPGASGDISPEEDGEFTDNDYIAWYRPRSGPYNPSPIVYGDYYYTLHDRGFLTCHDAKTGEEVYGRERFAGGATFTASPWAYNGKLFFLSEDGVTYVIEAGKKFAVQHENRLDELCLSSPAVSQGHVFIRTASKLYCIGE